MSNTPLLAHVAFSKRALQLSMQVDTTGDLSQVDDWFRPSVQRVCDGDRDPQFRISKLFASDDRLMPKL